MHIDLKSYSYLQFPTINSLSFSLPLTNISTGFVSFWGHMHWSSGVFPGPWRLGEPMRCWEWNPVGHMQDKHQTRCATPPPYTYFSLPSPVYILDRHIFKCYCYRFFVSEVLIYKYTTTLNCQCVWDHCLSLFDLSDLIFHLGCYPSLFSALFKTKL